MRRPIITLTTDFGISDWFVGTMKGVMAGIARHAQIIDITHAVPPGNIRAGAFALRSACRYFPKGTIHVAVVDPGVGSHRRALAVRTRNSTYVGPDNGILSWALALEEVLAVHSLDLSQYFLPQVSRTFHGRDVFAPVAAHLANGLPVEKLGWKLTNYVRLPWPEPEQRDSGIVGEVVYIDHFGNAITNLDTASLAEATAGKQVEVLLGRRRVGPLSSCYASVPKGKSTAVLGSSGFLEIAVNGGNAARALRIEVGTVVTARSPRPQKPSN